MEYSSNAKGNLGVTLGAVGTGLGLLDGGASLIGKMLGVGNGGANVSSDDKPVTLYAMGLIRESMDQKIENSYLRGQLDTATKLEGVQRQFTEQVGFNATMSANLNAVAGQTADLNRRFDRLTREFVPNEYVAPGWGRANVQPAPPLPPYPYAPYGPFPPFFPPQSPQPETAQTTTSSNG
jgi:hypothetical protein